MAVIHSVIVSYKRWDLTKQVIRSYYDTVTLPHTLTIVDNGSDETTCLGLFDYKEMYGFDLVLLGENRFPGYATNRGWSRAPQEATLLHRQDNDFTFLPNWCEHVLERFEGRHVGQVGLRTNEEELFAPSNVGGNNVIRRKLWDMGLRYDERPWGPEHYPKGWTEDSLFSPAVREKGFTWTRVKKPSIVPISSEDPNDPYYQKTWELRGIKEER